MNPHRSLLRLSPLFLALGAPDPPPDYEAIRQRRLARLRADFLAEGMGEDEAAAEVDRLDRAAMDIADDSPSDWAWAFDKVVKERAEVVRFNAAYEAARATMAADPSGSLVVDKPGRLVGPGLIEAVGAKSTANGTTMVEVNRRRREAGELGTKRQRRARRGKR